MASLFDGVHSIPELDAAAKFVMIMGIDEIRPDKTNIKHVVNTLLFKFLIHYLPIRLFSLLSDRLVVSSNNTD